MMTIIHINQLVIRANRKNKTNAPPISVNRVGIKTCAYGVDIAGPSRIVYAPDEPLSSGAHVWIETDSEVIER